MIRFLFSKTFLRQLLIAAVLAVVGFFGLKWYLNSYTDHGDYITVPNVSEMSLAQATAQLEELDLQAMLVDSLWSASAAPGHVCEQSPAFGEEVKRGRPVYLTAYRYRPSFVKLGVEEGERKNVAVIRLENKCLDYTIKYEPHELLYDCVIRVEHNGKPLGPRDEIRRDEKVVVYVGERRDEKIPVPHVYGMRLDSARKVLHFAGLTVGFAAFDSDLLTAEDTALCWVYEQRPLSERGTLVRVGSEVNLWLTNRPLPTTAASDSTDYDPDENLFD